MCSCTSATIVKVGSKRADRYLRDRVNKKHDKINKGSLKTDDRMDITLGYAVLRLFYFVKTMKNKVFADVKRCIDKENDHKE